MADPETMQTRPPLETTSTRQGRNVPIGAYVVEQVEYVAASTSVSVERDLYIADTTSGSVTMTLPALATVPVGKRFGFYKPVAANTLTIDGYSSETIEGSANVAVTSQYAMVEVIKVQTATSTYAWSVRKGDVAAGGALSAGSVSATELASNAVTNVKMADNSVDSAEIVAGAVDPVHYATTGGRIVAADGAVTLGATDQSILLAGKTAGAVAATMTATHNGHRIRLTLFAASGGGSYTLAASTADATSGTVTLNAAGEGVDLVRIGGVWYVERLIGGSTFA